MHDTTLRRGGMTRRAVLFVPAAAAAISVTGCGGDGANRVSGKVTFQGKPVPAGKIYFTPDGSKGNTGAPGYADIKNGEFDTGSGTGRGAATGAVVVAIEGTDPGQTGTKDKDDKSGEVLVKSLFARYETKLEVTGPMTKDFEVPADAGKALQKGEKVFVQP